MSAMFDSSIIWVPYPNTSQIIATGAILPALGIIVIGLRIYARRVQKWSMGSDDWLMMLAVV